MTGSRRMQGEVIVLRLALPMVWGRGCGSKPDEDV